MSDRINCVLIIDDDVDVRENLAEILTDEGFSVQTADCVHQGLEWLRQSDSPCVVLLDLVMPDHDGWEFLDELMTLKLASRTHPVIVVSGASDAMSALRMPGVVAVLARPFEVDDLLATLREHALPFGGERLPAE